MQKLRLIHCSPTQPTRNRAQGRKDHGVKEWKDECFHVTPGLWAQLSESGSRLNYEVVALFHHERGFLGQPQRPQLSSEQFSRLDQWAMTFSDTSRNLPTAKFWVAARVAFRTRCLFQLHLAGGPVQAGSGWQQATGSGWQQATCLGSRGR